jgi:hypothetical protein
MAIEVPRALVEYVLLGPEDDRRQLQDSPILADLWIAYGSAPDRPIDVLITPLRTQVASAVAIAISDRIKRPATDDANIAYLQGVVAGSSISTKS